MTEMIISSNPGDTVLQNQVLQNQVLHNEALHNGAAFLARSNAGILRLTDDDRADFLHRMTTNEINRLAVGRATVTVLTSPTARILQVFTVLARSDELWLLPAPDTTAALGRHLRGQIFFMDKVSVTDLSETYQRLRVVGPEATTALSAAGFAISTLEDDGFAEISVMHDSTPLMVTVLQQLKYELPGYELITPTNDIDALQELLLAAGITAVDEAAYEARRIELGRPASGHELTEEYNPLEAGIGWTCADDKGCYTGQEIIARQITYDKITKALVGLRSEVALPVGSALQVDGRTVGVVTSSALSPQLGAPIALAVVRRPHHQVGTVLQSDGQSVTVAALPLVA